MVRNHRNIQNERRRQNHACCQRHPFARQRPQQQGPHQVKLFLDAERPKVQERFQMRGYIEIANLRQQHQICGKQRACQNIFSKRRKLQRQKVVPADPDDRRERQPGDREALRQVPATRGLPCRADRGARAGCLPDGVLPAEGEVDPRRDDGLARGVRRQGAPDDPGAASTPRGRSQDGERRRGGAGGGAGHRRRHARAPDLATARADAGGRPGEDRARSRQDRAEG